MRRAQRAFTLVELLVVIAIIAVLMSILLPALRRVREQVKRTVCANQVRQQSVALLMYAQQNDGKMPLMTFAGGQWLWDVSYFASDAILHRGPITWTAENPTVATLVFWTAMSPGATSKKCTNATAYRESSSGGESTAEDRSWVDSLTTHECFPLRRDSISLDVLVTDSPPSAVHRSSRGRLRPTRSIVSITSSSGTTGS